MPDLQRILQLQLPSLHLHRNLQLSVQYPVHGILSQEHFSQDYLQHMIREKQESLQIKSRLQKM